MGSRARPGWHSLSTGKMGVVDLGLKFYTQERPRDAGLGVFPNVWRSLEYDAWVRSMAHEAYIGYGYCREQNGMCGVWAEPTDYSPTLSVTFLLASLLGWVTRGETLAVLYENTWVDRGRGLDYGYMDVAYRRFPMREPRRLEGKK